jgi:hypothetical protein
MMQSGPPPVDPRQVRPRRAWYAVAGTIALVGVLLGVVMLVLAVRGFGAAAAEFPEPTVEFEGSEPATVHLTAAKHWAVFMDGPSLPAVSRTPSTPTPSTPTPSTPPVSARCTGRAVDGGTVDLTQPSYSYTGSGAGGRIWYLLYEVRVSQDGRYEFSCTAADPDTGPGRYAVGEAPDIGGFVADMLGGFVGTLCTFASPCTGILIATVIIVVTAVRRNAHRSRLRFLPGAGPGMRADGSGRRAWGPGDGDHQDRI